MDQLPSAQDRPSSPQELPPSSQVEGFSQLATQRLALQPAASIAHDVFRQIAQTIDPGADVRACSGYTNVLSVGGRAQSLGMYFHKSATAGDCVGIAALLAEHSQQNISPIRYLVPRKEQYTDLPIELERRSDWYRTLGAFAYDVLGDTEVDLAYALLQQAYDPASALPAEVDRTRQAPASALSLEAKMKILEEERAALTSGREYWEFAAMAMKRFLTADQYLKRRRNQMAPSEVAHSFMRLMRCSRSARTRVLLLLEGQQYAAQATLATALVRYGTERIKKIHTMSEYEWWQDIQIHAKEQLFGKGAEPECLTEEEEVDREEPVSGTIAAFRKAFSQFSCLPQDHSSAPLPTDSENEEVIDEEETPSDALKNFRLHSEEILSHLSRVGALEEEGDSHYSKMYRRATNYLQTHKPVVPGLLLEEIDAPTLRAELEAAKNLRYSPEAVAAQERKILFAVHAALQKFHLRPEADGFSGPIDWYKTGSPAHLLKSRRPNCFSGVWLMAALLQECGIGENQLSYCDVYASTENHYETHAALLLSTNQNELLFGEYGYPLQTGKPLQLSFLRTKTMQKNLHGLLDDPLRSKPVYVEVKEDIAALLQIHNKMHISPLTQGLTTMHLLNTGLSFIHEQKFPEAQYALRMALFLHPRHPEICTQLGVIAYLEEKPAESSLYFDSALDSLPSHLEALYYKALTILRFENGRDRLEEVRAIFRTIAQDEQKILGDVAFKHHAMECLSLSDEELESLCLDDLSKGLSEE